MLFRGRFFHLAKGNEFIYPFMLLLQSFHFQFLLHCDVITIQYYYVIMFLEKGRLASVNAYNIYLYIYLGSTAINRFCSWSKVVVVMCIILLLYIKLYTYAGIIYIIIPGNTGIYRSQSGAAYCSLLAPLNWFWLLIYLSAKYNFIYYTNRMLSRTQGFIW